MLYLGASYDTEEDITDLMKNTLASQFNQIKNARVHVCFLIFIDGLLV